MLFGIVPPRPIDDLPESAPTGESTEWIILRPATELALPPRTDAAAEFFAGT
jgi:8-oxo-dGTP diphosphatase